MWDRAHLFSVNTRRGLDVARVPLGPDVYRVKSMVAIEASIGKESQNAQQMLDTVPMSPANDGAATVGALLLGRAA